MPSRTPRSKLVLFGTAVVVVLALSLGLGLGLGLEHSNASTSSGSTSASTAAASSTNTSQWGDYSATFVARDQLVNPADFVLAEAWDASAPPTTREFNWTVTEVWANPGAIWKRMLVVNGQSPGPTIHANTGDRIIVRVTNGLAENSTTLHWHGLYHRGTNFYDGAQSVTQCGIPPGATFTYDFTIQQGAMSTWWHSHSGVQYADGLFGALVLHSPNETAAFVQDAANGTAAQTPAYDGEQIFLLGDLYNTFAPELYWRYMLPGTGMDGQPGDEPVPDGGHINGISQSKCAYYPATNQVIPERRRALADSDDDEDEPASFERRNPGDGNFTVYAANLTCADANATATFFNATLSAGKTYRLRLANVGTFANVQFSIDNHTLTVVEAEGTSVEPVQVQSLVLGVAQRYSVLVTLDQTPGPYWIRSELMTDMFTYDNPGVETLTLGVLRYDGTDTDAMPAQADSAPDISGVKGALDISNVGGDLVPSDVIDAPDATLTSTVSFSLQYTADGEYRAFFNSTSYTALPSGRNTLLAVSEAVLAGESYSDDSQLMVNATGAPVVDLVVNSYDDGVHPFHLHGHSFWVVGEGEGSYVLGSSVLNATNPLRRDTLLIQAYSWVVLRFVADNPGLWLFHCHLSLSHQKAGLMMQIASISSTAAIQTLYDAIPQELRDQCAAYNASRIDTSTLAKGADRPLAAQRRLPRSPALLALPPPF